MKDITGKRKYEYNKIRNDLKSKERSRLANLSILDEYSKSGGKQSKDFKSFSMEKELNDDTLNYVSYQKDALKFFGMKPPSTK